MRDVHSELMKVSRNCGFTQELSNIIKEKFSEQDLNVLERWLRIVKEEKETAVNHAKNSSGFGRRF